MVPRVVELRNDLEAAETAVGRFVREMREGLVFLREQLAESVADLLACEWAAVRHAEHRTIRVQCLGLTRFRGYRIRTHSLVA